MSAIVSDLLKAGLIAVLVVSAAEGAASLYISRVSPHGFEVARNEHERFWPQYTAPRARGARERLLILITNSQGHVRREGGREGYPARLQALLNQRDPSHAYIVANWSIPGSNAPEMVVLAARAAGHRPDAVLLVSYSRNFQRRRRDMTVPGAGDLVYLAYLPEVRRHLSEWFLGEFEVSSLQAWFGAHSRLIQLHETIVSLVKGRTLGGGRTRPHLVTARPWSEVSDRLLAEFHRSLRSGLPDTPFVVVNMPLNPQRFTEESLPHLRRFTEASRALGDDDPAMQVWDAMDLIDPSLFTDDTHMAPEGYDRFAQWLRDRIMTRVLPEPR